jgi:hypothetical protein
MGLLANLEKAFSKLRRKRVSEQLFSKHNGIIQNGPFTGLKLTKQTNISRGVLAMKIFGLYEEAVIEELLKWGPFNDVIDIGAADGYFPLGMLKAGLAKRTICFAATKKGQASILANSNLNGCNDKVVVFGAADDELLEKIHTASFNPKKSLIICDIEGGEFEIFSKEFFQSVHGAIIIIELHDRIQGKSLVLRDELISLLPSDYSHNIIKSKPVSWGGISDLEALHDIDRSLVTSEGRKTLGEWLVARPS